MLLTTHLDEILVLVISFLVIYCVTLIGLARHILYLGKERKAAQQRVEYYKLSYIKLLNFITDQLSCADALFELHDSIREQELQRLNKDD